MYRPVLTSTTIAGVIAGVIALASTATQPALAMPMHVTQGQSGLLLPHPPEYAALPTLAIARIFAAFAPERVSLRVARRRSSTAWFSTEPRRARHVPGARSTVCCGSPRRSRNAPPRRPT